MDEEAVAYFQRISLQKIYISSGGLTFTRLHGVISQKIKLFITTGVRTSNPTITLQPSVGIVKWCPG
jgi:hypothetical protein